MRICILSLLLLCGCDTLSNVPKEANKVADKVEASVASIRAEIMPYAQTAVQLCSVVAPTNKGLCAELDSLASMLVEALDTAQAAVDAYRAGKGELNDAYQAARRALSIAEEYARKVQELYARSGE